MSSPKEPALGARPARQQWLPAGGAGHRRARLGAAAGARGKVARPDAPVLCVAGDGGFAHSWAELETARRMRLSLVLTVLNNQGLGYQRDWEDRMFGSHTDVCHFAPVDHAGIAEVCGWRARRIEDPADYGPALDEALERDQPTLLDVITEFDARPPITLFEPASG